MSNYSNYDVYSLKAGVTSMELKSHEYKENVTDIVFFIVLEIHFFSFYQSVRLISEYM